MTQTITILPLALASVLVLQGQKTEEGPIPRSKWKSDYTEKVWGLKLKSVKFTPHHVKVVLEFTKNLEKKELEKVKEAFTGKSGSLEFCFFDQDGVIFSKAGALIDYAIQGEIAGMKGDAIRCVIAARDRFSFLSSPEEAKTVAKVEFRPAPTD
jgi:hypothetical protein